MKKIIISFLMSLTVCACGVTKKDLGIEKESPDEMMVVSRAPLSIPPEFGLRPLVVENEEDFDKPELSAGEKALLQKMKDTLPAENQALYFEMRNFQNTFYNNGLNYISLLTGRYSETEKKKYVPYICGASIYVKATERLPLWNEAFFLYFEDADYSIQLRKLKFSFVQLQDAFYRHKISASSGKNQKAVIYRLESQIKFMRTHGKNYLVYVILKSLYLMSRFRFSELKVLLNKGGMLLHDRNSH